MVSWKHFLLLATHEPCQFEKHSHHSLHRSFFVFGDLVFESDKSMSKYGEMVFSCDGGGGGLKCF